MPVRSKKFRKSQGGFTLVEVIVSVVILGMVIEGVLLGYVMTSRRAEWSARSFAAQSVASQGAEQARSAKWDTQAWPKTVGPGGADELGITNYTQEITLDLPMNGKPVMATNYVRITTASIDPPVRQIRSECVWPYLNRGPFTNTVILLRAPDQ